MDLSITRQDLFDDVTLVTLVGEVDVYTSRRLRTALIKVADDGRRRLILDISATVFWDSTAIGVVVGGLKRARDRGGWLALVIAEDGLAFKWLRHTGLVKVIPVFEDSDKAVALARAGGHPWVTRSAVDEIGWHWFPARVYLSDEAPHEEVEAALQETFEALQMEQVYDFPPIHGSWFREFLVRMRDREVLTAEDAAEKLVRAAEMQVLHRPQADITAAEADAVAKLITSLEKSPSAVVQIGSVLLVKDSGSILVRNLTQRELAEWERNPVLFRDPASAFRELQRLNGQAGEGAVSEPSSSEAEGVA